ncbi:MAG: ATP-dependent DNA helicase [Acidimicrobiaceae bacterium]|nr:ATP-dependent DNA helicase [Acidimicrobiaceae bacterium]MBT5851610.1 ATP-dependent DNA helicase [Acidimicrobiaceae bacterium]
MTLDDSTLQLLDVVTAALPGGGETRDGQREMAISVAEAIKNDGHAVVQAGTGTGKSLAYLVPVVAAQRQTVVATATKALQDQLATKDLPFLVEQTDGAVNFAVLKGRSNYLCLQRLDEAEDSSAGTLEINVDDDPLDPITVKRLREFAAASPTGDRAELSDIDDRTWRLVSVGRDECPGASRCPRGDDCLAERARHRAATADILIVNLHLYALDVMNPGILPDHELVIVDEAHQLEDIMADAAGRQLSPARVITTARSAAAILSEPTFIQAAEDTAVAIHAALESQIGERLLEGPTEEIGRAMDVTRSAADKILNALRAVPDDAPVDAKAKAVRARQVATGLIDDLDAMRWPIDSEVLWVDGPSSNPTLRSTPIAVDEILAKELWGKRASILTSATLPRNTTARLGLPDTTTSLDVGSPFDYEQNALLYCPVDLPDPRAADHKDAQLAQIESLMVAAGGRTLGLFTSFAAMRDAAERLGPRLPWPVLVQGEGSKGALLDQFVEEPETSLFATMSFWQGVDAPGSTCSLVIIDRLPFPRPNDPVLQARRDRAGKSAFRTIDLPRAATLLAQGSGRLIRSTTDRGVVAVLDPRLATARSYRWELVNALPPMRRTRNLSEAETFLRELRDANEREQEVPA